MDFQGRSKRRVPDPLEVEEVCAKRLKIQNEYDLPLTGPTGPDQVIHWDGITTQWADAEAAVIPDPLILNEVVASTLRVDNKYVLPKEVPAHPGQVITSTAERQITVPAGTEVHYDLSGNAFGHAIFEAADWTVRTLLEHIINLMETDRMVTPEPGFFTGSFDPAGIQRVSVRWNINPNLFQLKPNPGAGVSAWSLLGFTSLPVVASQSTTAANAPAAPDVFNVLDWGYSERVSFISIFNSRDEVGVWTSPVSGGADLNSWIRPDEARFKYKDEPPLMYTTTGISAQERIMTTGELTGGNRIRSSWVGLDSLPEQFERIRFELVLSFEIPIGVSIPVQARIILNERNPSVPAFRPLADQDYVIAPGSRVMWDYPVTDNTQMLFKKLSFETDGKAFFDNSGAILAFQLSWTSAPPVLQFAPGLIIHHLAVSGVRALVDQVDINEHDADETIHRVIDDGVTSATTLWSSAKISDDLARSYGAIHFNGNTTATVISASGVWVQIAGTVVDGLQTDFSTISGGLRYDGLSPKTFRVLSTMSAAKVDVGSAILAEFAFFINGTLQSPSIQCQQLDDSMLYPQTTSVHSLFTLSQNDIVDVRVVNQTDSSDILCPSFSLAITQV